MTYLSFNGLRAFVAVVDHRSLGRAASGLNLTQPTLSRLVKELEARAGQPLFERHSRGMSLTAAGETLLPHARQLLFDMVQAGDAMDALRGLRRGKVRVGAVAAAARTILADAIGRLLADAPGLQVEVLEAPDDRLISELANRSIDLMIASQVPASPDIMRVGQCRFDDDSSVYCAADHPLLGQGNIGLPEVLKHSWVMPPGGSTPRSLFDQLVAEAQAEPPLVSVETGSLNAMVSIVARTNLLGWLPRPLLEAEQAAGTIRLLKVEALTLRRRFFLYRRRHGLLPLGAQRLRDCIPLLE